MNKVIFFYFILAILFSQTIYAEIRDPTRPSGYEESGGPSEVNAIIISSDRRIAIIGEKSVKVGDELFGEKVIAIDRDSVTLEGSNGRTVLHLIDKSIKQTSD